MSIFYEIEFAKYILPYLQGQTVTEVLTENTIYPELADNPDALYTIPAADRLPQDCLPPPRHRHVDLRAGHPQ